MLVVIIQNHVAVPKLIDPPVKLSDPHVQTKLAVYPVKGALNQTKVNPGWSKVGFKTNPTDGGTTVDQILD